MTLRSADRAALALMPIPALFLILALSGCAGALDGVDDADAADQTNGTEQPAEATPSSDPATADNQPTTTERRLQTSQAGTTVGGSPARAESASGSRSVVCFNHDMTTTGTVQRLELVETSGLAASRQEPGVLWAHNDSGRVPGVYAVDTSGADLGFFELVVDDEVEGPRDLEDMAISGNTIYLADIGDNAKQRQTVDIYVIDEPTIGADGRIAPREVISAAYPDGPTDAESLLVDPVSGEILILSKDADDDRALTKIYSLPVSEAGPDAASDDPVMLELVGTLDVTALTARSSIFSINALLFPGSVTGADVSHDGSLIALRTYGSVWLFLRLPDQTMAEALGGEPCEGGAESEAQGEAVAFLPPAADGRHRFVTVSEGSNPPVNVVTVELTER